MQLGWLVRLAWGASLLLVLALLEPSASISFEPAEGQEAPALVSLDIEIWGQAQGAEPLEERPVPGAQLELWQAAGDRYLEAARGESDARGHWAPRVPTGAYWLVARSAGFARAAVALVTGEGDGKARVVLGRARSLDVEIGIADEAGEFVPWPGATVLVGELGRLPRALISDATGHARFDDLPLGPQRVQVFARGYEPYVATTDANLTIRLRPVTALVVRVLDGGAPQAGAQVHVSGLSLWPPRTVETANNGEVEITGLSAGSYALYAELGEKVSEGLWGFEVAGERGRRVVELELRRGHFLDVRVVDDREEPVSGAHLTWSVDGMGQFARRGETDATGGVRLGPVVQRDGLVQVSAPGFVGRVVRVDREGALVVVLDREGTLSGRVVDEEGFPVAGAELEVFGTDRHGMPVFVRRAAERVRDAHFDWALEMERRLIPAGELGVLLGPVPPIPLAREIGGALGGATFSSDASGNFRIEGVPPGEVVVSGRHPDYVDGKSEPVTLGPGGRGEAVVVLRAGVPLRGRVVDSRGFPVGDARVAATGRGFSRELAVSPDGSFRFNAAPANVTLRVSRLDRPLRVLLEERLEARRKEEEITLTLPAPREPSRVVVRDQRGDAISLAEVKVISLEDASPLEETRFSSDRGEVEFADTRGLRVRLDVSAPGFVPERLTRTLAAEQEVKLTPALVVEGRVTAVRGRWPAEGAEVTIEAGGLTRHGRANDAGEYTIKGVPPGPLSLTARHPEHGQGRLSFVAAPGVGGRPTELPDLDLSVGVEIAGRVVDARGFPVEGAFVSAEPLSAYLPAALAPPGASRTDARGEFTLRAPASEPLVLYAARAAIAFGELRTSAQGRDRLDGVDVTLDKLDRAPPDATGTVLVSLELQSGALRVARVSRAPKGDEELRVGDRVITIDGETPRDLEDARALLSGVAGSEVELRIERGGAARVIATRREAFGR